MRICSRTITRAAVDGMAERIRDGRMGLTRDTDTKETPSTLNVMLEYPRKKMTVCGSEGPREVKGRRGRRRRATVERAASS